MPENTPDPSADETFSSKGIADAGTSAPTTSAASRREPVRVQSQSPSWIAPAALVVAIVAVALAAWALLSKSSPEAPIGAAAENSQGGDPKKSVCDTFRVVTSAVSIQTHNDLGPDPIPQAAVAGNARLALLGGGQYLLTSLQSDTPEDLSNSVRSFANTLQSVGMNALAGVPNSNGEQAARLASAEQDRKKIADMCK